MARFSNNQALAKRAPTSLGPNPARATTYEFGQGYKADDAHVELFNAAVNGFLADGFYESANTQMERLIASVAKCDPEWLTHFIPWLRTEAYLRSAPVVLAAEYARSGFPNSRKVIAGALQRADEPGEMLGYWFSRYGRNLPAAVKRGIADATNRLYTQRALLRYDGTARGWRFGDVIEVVHPKAVSPSQNALFKFALDRRRHDPVFDPELLGSVAATMALESMPQNQRGTAAMAEALVNDKIVFSWERAAGWLGRSLTDADWAALLPSMGYMAVMRNLNNFDKAGLYPTAVIKKLLDREAIQGSRVMPFRFLTAYKNLEADTYKVALAQAADMALENLPRFPGRTLIMVDCSGSMSMSVGQGRSRNPLRLNELAGFFAEAVARRCDIPNIVAYGSSDLVMPYKPHTSVLRAANGYPNLGGTNTWQFTTKHFHGQDRVLIITDEQSSDRDDGSINVPVITWNLAGYSAHHAAHGGKNRYLVAGVTDTVLQTLPAVIAHGSTGKWPWE